MSQPKYKYNTIKEFNMPGDYNFYGVIYDATFPVYEEKENLYHCTIKVIDQDVNCQGIGDWGLGPIPNPQSPL
jgi:hypothetical protein